MCALSLTLSDFWVVPQAKAKRRLVFGLRQVQKALRTKKAKMVMVAPNIEEVEARHTQPSTITERARLSIGQAVELFDRSGALASG